MAHRFSADRTLLEAHGFASVARVPFVMSWDMRYADEANRFLRERAKCEWHPANRTGDPTGKCPSSNALGQAGRRANGGFG